nr:c-type cytochrome [Candidatus Reidiella endopervernicosa]
MQNGTILFTLAEARGERLFNGKAQCILCHNTVDIDEQLFSDFEFRNIGVPANPTLITILGPFIDNGRGDVTGRARDNGRFRTPTLRNIAITAPYMHNGVFTSLTEVVEFYNTRDTTFPDPPEVSDNVDDFASIGELGLTNNEIADIVEFLETLSDQ